MAAIVNGGVSGDLNPGFAGAQAPVATAIALVRTTSLVTGLGDALSAQVSYGWDQVAGSARVVLPLPSGANGDPLVVSMGAGNNVQRFSGIRREDDTTLAPHSVTAVGKGPLYALEEYENSVNTSDDGKAGFPCFALTGASLVGAGSGTLQQIVVAVLNLVGVSFSLANLANPPHVYGLVGPEQFTWGTGVTAAAFLHTVLEASAGYRLFDSSDGNVYLEQMTAIPTASADFTFTLGQDIFGDSSALNSSIGQKQAVLVLGYDPDGSGPSTSGVVGSGSSVFRVNSQLIETNAFAAELAAYWLPVMSRRQQTVRLSTPRDDLLGPGQTIFVEATTGLSVSQKLWLKSVVTEIAANGAFTQHLVCIAGAL